MKIEFEDIMDDVELKNIGNIEDMDDVKFEKYSETRILETKCSKCLMK